MFGIGLLNALTIFPVFLVTSLMWFLKFGFVPSVASKYLNLVCCEY